jgi:hypothetical protein
MQVMHQKYILDLVFRFIINFTTERLKIYRWKLKQKTVELLFCAKLNTYTSHNS